MIDVSPLPTLAYKVGPNLFDLSSQLLLISLRDQMHRAVALAEALATGNQFRGNPFVLVVGAGVAGVSAGVVLARHGVEVQIVDSAATAPFALQRGINTRHVGPYMYEWPLDVYRSQELPPGPSSSIGYWNIQSGCRSPLSFIAQSPVAPDELVQRWDEDLAGAMAESEGRLRLQIQIDRKQSCNEVADWLTSQRRHRDHPIDVVGGFPWGPSLAPWKGRTPRFVLLAAGAGQERTVLTANGKRLTGAPFWCNDKILEERCGLPAAPRIVVFGGGDGALQDVLRAATGDVNPMLTWDKLRLRDHNGILSAVQSQLLALETQHAQVAVWSQPGFLRSSAVEVLDKAVASIVQRVAEDPHIAAACRDALRDRVDVASVDLCLRDFHFGKAYALNRFLVHLLEQCNWSAVAGKTRLSVHRYAEVVDMTTATCPTLLTLSTGTQLHADHVLIRFGASDELLPERWLALSKKDTTTRGHLAAVPLPLYFPPTR